jgi:type 1 glutamine amidotransferase/sugar phosphate isomerase/epimerase
MILKIVLITLTLGGLYATAQQQAEPFERAPDALERVSWRTRTLVGDDRLTQWKFGISSSELGDLTFLDAVIRADAAVVNAIEGSSAQKVSADIPKNLDYNLSSEEIATIRGRMGEIRMLAYRVASLPEDASSRRKLFEFAKGMGVNTLVVPANTQLDGLDALADEFAVNVAVLGNPAAVMASLQGHGKRLGLGLDTGAWAQDGVSPRTGLAAIKDRLLYVSLRDRSGRGANARNVLLGQGVGNLTEFFNELDRLNIRPLVMTLDTTGLIQKPADLFRAVEAFEAAVQPAYGENFTRFSRTVPIRRDLARPARDEKLSAEELDRSSKETWQKIYAAIPEQPYAAPKKHRKLLVIESLQGMSHNTIPHANVMLELMGNKTGAWETIFSNNLENLRYPKIKEYDAIFLNSIVGEFLPDPELRASLARYVREGGGLGGIHGTPWASRNWEEFGEMIGAKNAPHRIEQGILKVYDPSSPLMKPLGNKPLNFREEYYRFMDEGPYRLHWEDVRVLLTVELDDPKVEPRPWDGYKRPDKIYPVSWIRQYGKGRVFYCSLGHMPETFMTPELVGHFLAGVQFMLGDLDADTTPNPVRGSGGSSH